MPARSSTRSLTRRRSGSPLIAALLISTAIVAAAVVVSRNSSPTIDSQSIKPAVVAEFDTIKVPVPKQIVPQGKRIKEVSFAYIDYPKHQVPERAFHSVDAMGDQVALAALPAGVPIYPESLGEGGGGANPVMERIPHGMRAMTIRVDATSAVEGWASPGSVVDVLLVEKDRTTVIAEKVTILSAERSLAPVEGNAAPNVPSTVTLLATQEQTLAINTAIPLGRIAFALRGTRDDDQWLQNSYSAERLQAGRMGVESSAPVKGFVELKDGDQKQRYVFRDGRWTRSEVVPEGKFPAREKEDR